MVVPFSGVMSRLRIEAVGDATIGDWRRVHNTIIPTAPLSLDEVRERTGRNRLEVAYAGGVLIGCSTVRPPDEQSIATVIVRVLAEHRRQGYGAEFLLREMAHAQALKPAAIETIVLESNADGLRFAISHGFTEVDRYLPPDSDDPFITMRLTDASSPGDA